MTAIDLRALGRQLKDIGSLVRCLPAPSSRDPEAFHIARSERASDIDKIAYVLWPEGRRPEAPNHRPKPPAQGLPMSPRRR